MKYFVPIDISTIKKDPGFGSPTIFVPGYGIVDNRRFTNEWLYQYENIELKCSNCKKPVKFNDLESEEELDGSFSCRVCPKCGKWECCDLDFENIEAALKRRGDL